MDKILAKCWQNYIFMTTVCQFSISISSIYWQKQYYTKEAHFEKGMSDCLQTKTILISVVSLS